MRRSLLVLFPLLFALILVLLVLRQLLGAALPSTMVAYMTLETGLPVVIVEDLDHGLRKRLDFDFFTDPSFSPDGARLALTSYLRFGSDIVVHDLTSGATLRLTESVAIAESPAWSPDGAWIAFASNREGDNNIYIIRPGRDRQAARHCQQAQATASRPGRPMARRWFSVPIAATAGISTASTWLVARRAS